MANRIELDPSKIPCPEFAGDTYSFVRNALISDANMPDITTDALATQKLRKQWQAENTALQALYQAQTQADQALAEQQAQEEEAALRAVAVEREQREAEVAKETEKKRTPLYSFHRGTGITSIPLHIHPHARKMIAARKYFTLWHLLPEASQEARERSRDTSETNRFQLVTNDDTNSSNPTLTLIGSHNSRASPNAIPDSKLSWAQVQRAKSAFLQALVPIGNYNQEYVQMFAEFYTNMDMHRELQQTNSDLVMALYHAEMRFAFYEAVERQKPFDLSVIAEDILEDCRKQIRSRAHTQALNGMSIV
ncbi:hypothetical protein BDP27DRAFT_1369817 [Rhodocollybia butyracea]|uniref:Uncharacterized protein n=1 Tax=Rhodocollybia butyracea TaxID=206335 RepID=A0A9P5PEL6_9AGAR|nr:hypothetical protein BDP27DRAFT_1369817 [Rhodocollybia butyracea]